MAKHLDVYLHDSLAGRLVDAGNAQLEFKYDADYLDASQQPLSISLPLQKKPFTNKQCNAFFAGLLPDENELTRLARYLKVSRHNVFKLLAEVGGECAGAVSLFAKPPDIDGKSSRRVLSNEQVEEILKSSEQRPIMGGDEKVRLSLAGAQRKIALVISGDCIMHSSPSLPSTHIIKPASSEFPSIVENEFYCMQLAKLVGIDVPETRIRKFGDTTALQVQRYDRTPDGKRIHQEDFCQALNVGPENKYENEGGPSLQDCIDLILNHSSAPAIDYQQLLNRVIFNYLIGNNDAHGKNFSLIHSAGKTRLAPAYDLLSTAIYPSLNEKMAMKIGGRNKPADLQLRHWERLVPDMATAKKSFRKSVLRLCEQLEAALPASVPEESNFKIQTRKEIAELVDTRITKLGGMFDQP